MKNIIFWNNYVNTNKLWIIINIKTKYVYFIINVLITAEYLANCLYLSKNVFEKLNLTNNYYKKKYILTRVSFI